MWCTNCDMKILLAIFVLILLYVGWESVRMLHLLSISRELVAAAKPYSIRGVVEGTTVLILGDSTGVGVGAAKPEESVPGRIGEFYHATHVENYSESGASARDMQKQATHAQLASYDIALVMVGGNDIIRFRSAHSVAQTLEPVLEKLKTRAGQVILVAPGNVGGAQLFSFPLSSIFHRATLRYHRAFQELADSVGITYVNLYTEPHEDPFIKEPVRYLAVDKFHPSSDGYGLWFDRIARFL